MPVIGINDTCDVSPSEYEHLLIKKHMVDEVRKDWKSGKEVPIVLRAFSEDLSGKPPEPFKITTETVFGK